MPSLSRATLALALVSGLAAPVGLLPATPAAAAPALTAPRAQVLPGTVPTAYGFDRIGVRRGDSWILRDSLDGGLPSSQYREESGGWQPVAGDFDGDGEASLGLFRDGVWKLRNTAGGVPTTIRFGLRGDQPVVGDFDGDGVDTLALFRRGTWFLRDSNSPLPTRYRTFRYGLGSDVAVVGDWDADGQDDIAVRRGVTWYQRDDASSGATSRTFRFGLNGDLPVAGDWDHSGRDTPGLFRNGTWFFARGSGFGGYQVTRFGQRGDRPVVRRTQGLAPGVTHRVVRGPGPTFAHVAEVELSAASSPDAVLSGGNLAGVETTSSMTARSGAVVGINGDYFLSSGRPVHVMAADSRLLQTPQLLGRAFSLDAAGTKVQMGFPDVGVTLSRGDTPTALTRWNSGAPDGSDLSAFTGIGAGVDVPPNEACYIGANTSAPVLRPDGTVESRLDVTGTRCGGPGPYLGPNLTALVANRGTGGEDAVRATARGSSLTMATRLGFPGAVDVMGGNPLLVKQGTRQDQDLYGSGAFFAKQPRTAVGVTADGRMLLVVVDGRSPGYSVGMTLYELADLMQRLGAVDAINLDGGGSSTFVLNGLVANRPSDGGERGVANALVVLPEADPGERSLQTSGRSSLRSRGSAPLPVTLPVPVAPVLPDTGRTFSRAAVDPGSIGGLADAEGRRDLLR